MFGPQINEPNPFHQVEEVLLHHILSNQLRSETLDRFPSNTHTHYLGIGETCENPHIFAWLIFDTEK